MYIDIISYKLADGISEEHLREAAADIVEVWMRKQEGFRGWKINRLTDDAYQDFVYWENKEAAEKAQENMKDIPEGHAWMGCYNMSTVQSISGEQLAEF